jgi:hypothetical protein
MIYPLLILLWIAVFGPFWLLGWGVLNATKHLNWLAAHWCKFLLYFYPREQ